MRIAPTSESFVVRPGLWVVGRELAFVDLCVVDTVAKDRVGFVTAFVENRWGCPHCVSCGFCFCPGEMTGGHQANPPIEARVRHASPRVVPPPAFFPPAVGSVCFVKSTPKQAPRN